MKTVFYHISDGEIERVIQGEQNMLAYGDDKSEYETVIDFIFIDDEAMLFGESHKYKIIDEILVKKTSEEIDL